MQLKILLGNRSQGSSWEFIISSESGLIPLEDCTATKCIIIEQSSNKVLLAKTHRGWELPGGHIEAGETLHSATIREIFEETGCVIEHNKISLFGYIKVINSITRTNKSTGESYPNPSYIPYFLYENNTITYHKDPSGEDATQSGLFSITDNEIINSEHYNIILLGLMKYLSTKS